jgi:2'-5' RNA ligase
LGPPAPASRSGASSRSKRRGRVAETAIIVPVPEAEAIVGRWRRRYTPSGAAGMPAHVTLLVPFTGSEKLGARQTRAVKEVLAQFEPIELTLRATAYFEGPPIVLYLVPEPAEPFRAMTAALVSSFPEHPPYGDAHATIVPHLTVATRLERERLAAIEAEVAEALPISARPGEAWLMEDGEHAWRLRDRFAFAAGA